MSDDDRGRLFFHALAGELDHVADQLELPMGKWRAAVEVLVAVAAGEHPDDEQLAEEHASIAAADLGLDLVEEARQRLLRVLGNPQL